MAIKKGIFGTAKKIEAGALKPQTGGAREVETDGLLAYASICAVEKALEGLKAMYKVQVEAQQTDEFIHDGCKLKHRPKNYKGVEGVAEASMQLRKRSTRSKLSPDQIARLRKAGVNLDIQERYTFNEALLTPQVLADSRLNRWAREHSLFDAADIYMPDSDLLKICKNDCQFRPGYDVPTLTTRFLAMQGHRVEGDWDTTDLATFITKTGNECGPETFERVKEITDPVLAETDAIFARERIPKYKNRDRFIELANSIETALRLANNGKPPQMESPGAGGGMGEGEPQHVMRAKRKYDKTPRAECFAKGRSPLQSNFPSNLIASEAAKSLPQPQPKTPPQVSQHLGEARPDQFHAGNLPNYSLEAGAAWAPMTKQLAPLTRHFKARVPTASGCPSHMGYHARHWGRWFGDKMIMDGRGRKETGTLLVDVSGSMSWSQEQTCALIEACPSATVALYSSHRDHGRGMLTIIAQHGRAVTTAWFEEEMRRDHGGGNSCDGLALAWLCNQKGPRVWFSDGHVTLPTTSGERMTKDALTDAFRLAMIGAVTITVERQHVIDLFSGRVRPDPCTHNPGLDDTWSISPYNSESREGRRRRERIRAMCPRRR